jgi:hypothetical protein
MVSYVGRIWLGLPNGFSRLGPTEPAPPLHVFNSLQSLEKKWGECFNQFNVAVWKFRDEGSKHVFIRVYQPRLNVGFTMVVLNVTDEDWHDIDGRVVKPEEMD